jgi:hypothetical protein
MSRKRVLHGLFGPYSWLRPASLLAAASSKAEAARHNYVNLGIHYPPGELRQVDSMQGLGNIPRKNVGMLDIPAEDVDLVQPLRVALEVLE